MSAASAGWSRGPAPDHGIRPGGPGVAIASGWSGDERPAAACDLRRRAWRSRHSPSLGMAACRSRCSGSPPPAWCSGNGAIWCRSAAQHAAWWRPALSTPSPSPPRRSCCARTASVGLLAVVFLFARRLDHRHRGLFRRAASSAAPNSGRRSARKRPGRARSPACLVRSCAGDCRRDLRCDLAVARCRLAAILSIASQAGDLFESHLKRRFGVKDASHVIPGHGGVMDRLDGFIAAASVAAVMGLARGGLAHPGRGMLIW